MMFEVEIIDNKGKRVKAKARMRFGVYAKTYYGNKLVALFENLAGALEWQKKMWDGCFVVALVRDEDDHVAGYPMPDTANADMMKMEDS